MYTCFPLLFQLETLVLIFFFFFAFPLSQQPSDVIYALGVVASIVPAACVLASGIFVWAGYQVSREDAAENSRELRERRREAREQVISWGGLV
jgi:Na+/melibiose symporter-like transporter